MATIHDFNITFKTGSFMKCGKTLNFYHPIFICRLLVLLMLLIIKKDQLKTIHQTRADILHHGGKYYMKSGSE